MLLVLSLLHYVRENIIKAVVIGALRVNGYTRARERERERELLETALILILMADSISYILYALYRASCYK